MNIETAFAPGDKAWCLVDQKPELLTVGQVRVKITDSPGVNGGVTMPEHPSLVFDNYTAQAGRKEEYMMVETGVGSGLVFELGKTVFATEEEAARALEAKREEVQA